MLQLAVELLVTVSLGAELKKLRKGIVHPRETETTTLLRFIFVTVVAVVPGMSVATTLDAVTDTRETLFAAARAANCVLTVVVLQVVVCAWQRRAASRAKPSADPLVEVSAPEYPATATVSPNAPINTLKTSATTTATDPRWSRR